MAEHPILFSGEMVRAILEGRKTQTRRVIGKEIFLGKLATTVCVNGRFTAIFETTGTGYDKARIDRVCAYGVPGDTLWVRETWRETQEQPGIMYRADGWEDTQSNYDLKWRPSIFMPRRTSRLTLEITGARVERLQDISEGDAKAEGVQGIGAFRELFAITWDEINAKRGFSWQSNPFVWVVSFNPVGRPNHSMKPTSHRAGSQSSI